MIFFAGKPWLSSLPDVRVNHSPRFPHTSSRQTSEVFVSWSSNVRVTFLPQEGNSGRAPHGCSFSVPVLWCLRSVIWEKDSRGATLILVMSEYIRCAFLELPSFCVSVGGNSVKCKQGLPYWVGKHSQCGCKCGSSFRFPSIVRATWIFLIFILFFTFSLYFSPFWSFPKKAGKNCFPRCGFRN